jgi:predicted ATPase
LLLLDNFEQIIAAAPLVGDLLSALPGLKVLVTSREALHIYAEQEYHVPPLALPNVKRAEPLPTWLHYEAVQLFTQRAQAVKPGFAITAANVAAVARFASGWMGCRWQLSWRQHAASCFHPR